MPHARPQRPATASPLATTHGNDGSRRPRTRFVWIVGLALAALLAQPGRAQAAKPGEAAAVPTPAGVQKLVNAMRKELALTHVVTVEVVVHNPLKASVEPVKVVTRKGTTRSFRLSIERAFLEKLTADELRAVIAHELGHVWIYTHHPYLQTEQLANAIAMRVVPRDNLVKVYSKVWAETGPAGSLPRFAEEPTAAGIGSRP
jgi:hypothetical protein